VIALVGRKVCGSQARLLALCATPQGHERMVRGVAQRVFV
jgi:hypothetical protein